MSSSLATRTPNKQHANSPRVIEFAGYTWEVKIGRNVGPGPNNFSDSEENVFVDDDGLHLVLLRDGDRVNCAEIIGPELGYGEYLFTVKGDFPSFHPAAVFAVFCYRSDTAEFDFELATWNKRESPNAQFVGGQPAGDDSLYRFQTGGARELTISLFYGDGVVRGQCWNGGVPGGNLLGSFTYQGAKVPEPQGVRVRSNLWVFQGQSPQDLQTHEVIIKSFTFKATDAKQ